MNRIVAAFVCCLVPWTLAHADAPPPSHWEQDIRSFEALDRSVPPARGAVLFVGSSSIRLWPDLAADFPGVTTINRGFGGSEIADAVHFADRIVIPYAPRQIVLYAGDNDLMNGKSPAQVAAAFATFVDTVQAGLPDVRIAFIAIKPSPARATLMASAREANGLIRRYAADARNIDFIDIYTPMLDRQGQPRPELFVEDALHLNGEGYELWRRIVAPFLLPDPD
jgi:lysophospholipase L1-like esterase